MPATDLFDLVHFLQALHRRATSVPWDARPELDKSGEKTGAWLVNGDSMSIRVKAPTDEQSEADAVLLSALRNAWPALYESICAIGASMDAEEDAR